MVEFVYFGAFGSIMNQKTWFFKKCWFL